MSFSGDLANFSKAAIIESERKIRAVCLELGEAVVDATPVDTGRLRNNWFYNVGTASSETTDSTNVASRRIQFTSALAEFRLGQSIYLTNNMPYARRIEYEGYSNKAPNGMLRVTVERLKPLLRDYDFEVY